MKNGRRKVRQKESPKVEEPLIRRRLIVLYADLRGFSSWTRRIAGDGAMFLKVMRPFSEYLFSIKQEYGCHVSRIGDAGLCIFVVEKTRDCHLALQVLRIANRLVAFVNGLRQRGDHPKIRGIRIRITSGEGWEWNDSFGRDFYSEMINVARYLLDVYPDEEIVCHDNFVELLGPKHRRKAGAIFAVLPEPVSVPEKLERDDARSLKSFRFRKRARRR